MDDARLSGLTSGVKPVRCDVRVVEGSNRPITILDVDPCGRRLLIENEVGYSIFNLRSHKRRELNVPQSEGVYEVEFVKLFGGQVLAQCVLDMNHSTRSTRVALFDLRHQSITALPPVFLAANDAPPIDSLSATTHPEVVNIPEILQRDLSPPGAHVPLGVTADGRIYGHASLWNGRRKFWCYWEKNEAGVWMYYKLHYANTIGMGFGTQSMKYALIDTHPPCINLRVASPEGRKTYEDWLHGKHPKILGVAGDNSFFGEFQGRSQFRKDGKRRAVGNVALSQTLYFVSRPSWGYRPLVLDIPKQSVSVLAISVSGDTIAGLYGTRPFVAHADHEGYRCTLLNVPTWSVRKIAYVSDTGTIIVEASPARNTVKFPNGYYLLMLSPVSA